MLLHSFAFPYILAINDFAVIMVSLTLLICQYLSVSTTFHIAQSPPTREYLAMKQ